MEKSSVSIDEQFEIRTDVLCNYYFGHEDPKIKKLIAAFLSEKGRIKRTASLYSDFISRQTGQASLLSNLPDREKWQLEDFVTASCARTMVEQMLKYTDIIHDGPSNWNIYFFLVTRF